ncbi:hypothetical protein L2E82_13321 [Cichorium intybus]|uniref:Uncharacterized protein n=1 Tax=Cichorium intybus TaxID=13427 RepID=A0ACB9EX87_CICIN|nr:hypothetical protein L2E82_13321 [Cichorium intybus]
MGCISSKHVAIGTLSPVHDSSLTLADDGYAVRRFPDGNQNQDYELWGIKEGTADGDKVGNDEDSDSDVGEHVARKPAFAISIRYGRSTVAEHVAAGWPAWLSAVAALAGEAIVGWVPQKSDSFERYENCLPARDLRSGKMVALKKVRFDNFQPESVRFMAREITILRRLDHPNIMKLQGIITSRHPACHVAFTLRRAMCLPWKWMIRSVLIPSSLSTRFVLDACQDTTLIILMVATAASLALGIKTEGIKEGLYDGGNIALVVIIVIVITVWMSVALIDDVSHACNLYNLKLGSFPIKENSPPDDVSGAEVSHSEETELISEENQKKFKYFEEDQDPEQLIQGKICFKIFPFLNGTQTLNGERADLYLYKLTTPSILLYLLRLQVRQPRHQRTPHLQREYFNHQEEQDLVDKASELIMISDYHHKPSPHSSFLPISLSASVYRSFSISKP